MSASYSPKTGSMLLMVAGLVLLTAGDSSAKKAKGEFGIVFGQISGMTIETTDKETDHEGELETDAGLSAAVFFEQTLYRRIWLGVSIDFIQVRQELWGNHEISEEGLGLTLRLSGRLQAEGSRWTFRPGIGSGVMMVPQIGFVQASQHWTLMPFVEAVYNVSPKTGILGQFFVFNTVQGGNDDLDMKAGPAIMVRFGLLFR